MEVRQVLTLFSRSEAPRLHPKPLPSPQLHSGGSRPQGGKGPSPEHPRKGRGCREGTWAPPAPRPGTAAGTWCSGDARALPCPPAGTQVLYHPHCCPRLTSCLALETWAERGSLRWSELRALPLEEGAFLPPLPTKPCLILNQGLARFSCKESDSKHFRHCGPLVDSAVYSPSLKNNPLKT